MGLSLESPPWHGAAWERVAGWLASGRVPHAVLITGRPGLGKALLAEALAAGLLCHSPGRDGRACGQCRSCRLVAAGSHPDLARLEPQEPGKPIRVEQVRELSAGLALRAALGRRKTALLVPADAMNRNAANALLKTLEEPPGDAVLLLVSHVPGRLPATVLSRCQRLGLSAPSADVGRAWLERHWPGGRHAAAEAGRLLALAGGAPLAALTLAETGGLALYTRVEQEIRGILTGELDPLAVAERWRDSGLARVCRWSYRVAGELLRAAFDPSIPGVGSALGPAGPPVPEGLAARALFRVTDRALDTLRALDQGVTLNEQLALDDLACAWAEVGRARGA